MKLRIAILCSDDSHHKYLCAKLAGLFGVVLVVEEPALSQRRRLWKKKRYKDYIYSLYHSYRRRLLGLNAVRREYFSDIGEGGEKLGAVTHRVDWINEKKTARLLREAGPDLTVVMGTSILKKRVLEAGGKMIINIHGGCLPYYRGNHCIFQALYDGAYEKIASTIHFIDNGIDTGDIIERVYPAMTPGDFAESLYSKAEKTAIERLVYWLQRYEKGFEFPRIPQDSSVGRLIYTRDRKIYHDMIFWLKRRLRMRELPYRKGVLESSCIAN